ncbi:hypothetical protein V1282_006122 [Nitrobacteraceae bacterium AZCC 2146]
MFSAVIAEVNPLRNVTLDFCAGILLTGWLAVACLAPAAADPRNLSQMPDPRGEFIRLCAPFMVSRYAHPEAICDCVRTSLISEIGDQQVLDAILFGVTERGVPMLDRSWLPPEKRPLIGRTMTAIAEPTMECMFGNGQVKRAADKIPIDGFPSMLPTQDFAP